MWLSCLIEWLVFASRQEKSWTIGTLNGVFTMPTPPFVILNIWWFWYDIPLICVYIACLLNPDILREWEQRVYWTFTPRSHWDQREDVNAVYVVSFWIFRCTIYFYVAVWVYAESIYAKWFVAVKKCSPSHCDRFCLDCSANPSAIIRKYHLDMCRQCFRERAGDIGFIKVSAWIEVKILVWSTNSNSMCYFSTIRRQWNSNFPWQSSLIDVYT